MITDSHLAKVAPHCPAGTRRMVLKPLQRMLHDYQMSSSPLRVASVLSQVLHECSEFRQVFEVWGPTDAQGRYDGRHGNTQPGDGFRYRGRGWIQVTFRDNYRDASAWIRNRWQHLEADALHTPDQLEYFRSIDLERNPRQAAQHTVSAETCGWYWTTRNLNALADAGDVEGITRAVNGGLNGLAERVAYYHRALEVLRGA